jgi:phage recombination protein Bet
MAFAYCKSRGLDVLKKVVHIVPMLVEDKSTGISSYRDVIMPGIAEARITASRTGQQAGLDAPVWGPLMTIPVTTDREVKNPREITVPEFCQITAYKLVHGQRVGFTHEEYFMEAVARDRSGTINSMWQKRSRGQLAKCAEAGALRKAFPEELGGEATAEEMEGHQSFEIVPAPEPVAANGPSGIPGPTEVGEIVDAEFVPTPEPVATEAPATAEAPAPAPDPIPEPVATPEPAPAPVDAGGLTIDVPGGALSVLTAQMRSKGITEVQLLTKLGQNITARNINEALALIKGWK